MTPYDDIDAIARPTAFISALGLILLVLLTACACIGCGRRPRTAPGRVEACVAVYEDRQSATFFVLPDDVRARRLEDGWAKARAFVLAYAAAERRPHRAPSERPKLDAYRTEEEMLAASGRKHEGGRVLAGFTDRTLNRVGLLGYDEDVLLHEAAHWYLLTDDCEACEAAVRWAHAHPHAVEDGLRGLLNR